MKTTPAQDQMVDFLTSRPNAMLAAGMGLGKTRACIRAMSHLWLDGQINGALIVAPLRVVELTWPTELTIWPELRFARVHRLRTPEGVSAWKQGQSGVYLVNYDILDKLAATLLPRHPSPVNLVVWDEITKAKNPSSKRINKFRKFRNQFQRHWGLTGTLMSEGFLDVFAPYRLLDGGERLGTVFHQFRSRYFESDFHGYKWTPREWARNRITEKTADMTLILRREDHLDIPPVEVVDEDIALPPVAMGHYRYMEKHLLAEFDEGKVVAVNSAVQVFKLLQITSGAIYDEERNPIPTHDTKIQKAVEIHNTVREPVIYFTHFIHEKERLLAAIPGAREFSPDIMGDWDKGKIRALVANPMSAGHGLNLQKPCRRVVWLTLPYSRDVYDQANARVARKGQTRPVFIHRIMAKHTIDWAVAEALRHKEDEQRTLFTIWNSLKLMRRVTSA